MGLAPFFAMVVAVHSDRNTCDIRTIDGLAMENVPVLGKFGLADGGNVWGEVELPSPMDYVIVMFIGEHTRQKIIIGTIAPYLVNEYQTGQIPPSSTSKTYTKKLLEPLKNKGYKKIFQSGTTVEVFEDGSTVVETPSGTYIEVDETLVTGLGKTTISAKGNTFVMDTPGVSINGTNLEVLP